MRNDVEGDLFRFIVFKIERDGSLAALEDRRRARPIILPGGAALALNQNDIGAEIGMVPLYKVLTNNNDFIRHQNCRIDELICYF